MSSAGNESATPVPAHAVVHVHVDPVSMRLSLPDGSAQHSPPVARWTDALPWLGESMSLLPRRHRVEVWVAGAMCRPVVVPMPAGTTGRRESLEIARRVALQASGWSEPCAVAFDGDVAGDRAFAVVITQATVDALVACIGATRHRLSGLRPWWAHVLAVETSRAPDLEALAVYDGDTLTLLAGAGRDISAAHTMGPIPDAVGAGLAARRWLVSAGADASRALAVRYRPHKETVDLARRTPGVHDEPASWAAPLEAWA